MDGETDNQNYSYLPMSEDEAAARRMTITTSNLSNSTSPPPPDHQHLPFSSSSSTLQTVGDRGFGRSSSTHTTTNTTAPNKNILISFAGLQPSTSQSKNDPHRGTSKPDNILAQELALSALEIVQLRLVLAQTNGRDLSSMKTNPSTDSDYPVFQESTHAWAVFADNPQKRAGPWERLVGSLIIVFQLFAYYIFAAEAIEDFKAGNVPVMIAHQSCIDSELNPRDSFQCEAEFTNTMDAFVAFTMLGIFLAHDMLQAMTAIRDAPLGIPILFAIFAGIEVICAFLAASIAVSYNLFIGEVTDAVEVGVGLLFIRELSQQTYHGIGSGKTKQFRNFLLMVMVLVGIGMILDPLTAKIFAGYVQ